MSLPAKDPIDAALGTARITHTYDEANDQAYRVYSGVRPEAAFKGLADVVEDPRQLGAQIYMARRNPNTPMEVIDKEGNVIYIQSPDGRSIQVARPVEANWETLLKQRAGAAPQAQAATPQDQQLQFMQAMMPYMMMMMLAANSGNANPWAMMPFAPGMWGGPATGMVPWMTASLQSQINPMMPMMNIPMYTFQPMY